MKKIVIATLAALLLAGCDYEAEQRADRVLIEEKLPAGCTFRALGDTRWNGKVNVVICRGRDTTTTNTEWRSGKSTYRASTAVID